MELAQNPLLMEKVDIVSDLENIDTKCCHTKKKRKHKRELRDLRRAESALTAIEGFDIETAIYGFTKGQFSLIQLIRAVLDITGKADFVISTWTAAHADVTEILGFCDTGELHSAKWIVDLTFTKRSPELANRIRQVFGDDSIRVAKNHAKYVLIGNEEWKVVIHTSMNLNHNPRFENFEIAHDPELYKFHNDIIREIWEKQDRNVDRMRPYEIEKEFNNNI